MTTAARSTRRPQPVPSRSAALAWATADMVVRNPWRVLAAVATVGCISVVGLNAVRQPLPHPAPLFAGAKPSAPPAEPPRRPDFTAASLAPAVPAVPAKVDIPAAPARVDTARKPPANDPIGALLRSSEPVTARAAEPKPVSTARVGTAQRALSKLGYGPIEADGLLGATTRQALEKFERDRSLPVTGSLGSRTARQLAAASGYAIE